MKLGIKVNADRKSFDRLNGANPQLAEVWFNANDANRYTDLFNELKRRKCDVGLHFWGQLHDQLLPNIAYPDHSIIDQSMDLMRQTIDIASRNHFQYVNIHPGSAAVLRVDYKKERYEQMQKPVDTDLAIAQFLLNAAKLHAYAKDKHVVFTIETVPQYITDGWYDTNTRLTPKKSYELPTTAIQMAAKRGLWVANDFCHTAANVISDDPNIVWTYLKGFSAAIAAQTRLVHVGFIIPPYNGTDNHDELDNPMLDTEKAVPNTKQITELLSLYKHRSDVWILAEPKANHVKNYLLVQKILERI